MKSLLCVYAVAFAISTLGATVPFENIGTDTQERLSRYATTHAYTDAEAQSLLRGLDQLPSRTIPAPPRLPAYTYPPDNSDACPITAVVNPVCSECGRVLNLLLSQSRNAGTADRKLLIMLSPSSIVASKTATCLLDWVRENNSDVFLPILLDLAEHEPHTADEVFTIASRYMNITVRLRSNVVAAAHKPRPRSSTHEPSYFYRDRVLSPVRVDDVVYDPLKNDLFLSETLTTIDNYFAKR